MLLRWVLAPLAAVTLLLGVAACAPASDAAPTVSVGAEAVILDVRTPAEYAEGHLEGAQLLDLNAGEVSAQAASLDPAKQYFVYCRSGNRSAQAAKILEQAGITGVTDLGAMQAASSTTGITVVAE